VGNLFIFIYIYIIKSYAKYTGKEKEQVLSSSWDGWSFDHNRHWPKIGGCVPFGGSWVPM